MMIDAAETGFSWVEDHPNSALAEAVRGAKIAVDNILDRRETRIIGIVSCLPGEGKSMVASNLAYLFAMGGDHTLLLDGDLRRGGLTAALLPRPPSQGVVEVAGGHVGLEDVAVLHDKLPLTFVPGATRKVSDSSGILSSTGLQSFLSAARGKFRYVIIDLPPICAVVDAKAIAPFVDAFIMVVEWGKTPRSLVKSALRSNSAIARKCVGVLLSQVDTERLRSYAEAGNSERYMDRAQAYYG